MSELRAILRNHMKDKLARKLKRVGRGVCPECNRTFQNLASHMACKHGEKK